MLVHDWESVTTQPCGPQSRDGATPAPSPQTHPKLEEVRSPCLLRNFAALERGLSACSLCQGPRGLMWRQLGPRSQHLHSGAQVKRICVLSRVCFRPFAL